MTIESPPKPVRDLSFRQALLELVEALENPAHDIAAILESDQFAAAKKVISTNWISINLIGYVRKPRVEHIEEKDAGVVVGTHPMLKAGIESERGGFSALAHLSEQLATVAGKRAKIEISAEATALFGPEAEKGLPSENEPDQCNLFREGAIKELGDIFGVGIHWEDPIDIDTLPDLLTAFGYSFTRKDGETGSIITVDREGGSEEFFEIALAEFNLPEADRMSWSRLLEQIEAQVPAVKTEEEGQDGGNGEAEGAGSAEATAGDGPGGDEGGAEVA